MPAFLLGASRVIRYKVPVFKTIDSAWQLARSCLSPMIRQVLPLIVLWTVLRALFTMLPDSPVILGAMWLCIQLIHTLAAATAVMILCDHFQIPKENERLSFPILATFFLAGIFIQLAVMIGGAILLPVALFIYGSACLAPVIVISRRSSGIISAITDSVDLTKGNLWRITAALCLVFLGIFAAQLLLSSLSRAADEAKWIGYVGLSLLEFVGLATYALPVVLYRDLLHVHIQSEPAASL
jgi:hypothetical protein